MIRLQKILSAAGVASRRAAESYIREGRVSVNGVTVTELGSRADPDRDDIRLDGRRIQPRARRVYILLHKPRGYITSRSDPQRRPTVVDLLMEGGVREYVYPVGRLDYDSEGLLLLTSDGDLAARLTHPRHGVEREYHVQVRGIPDPRTLERLERGIVIDGRRTAPARVRVRKTFDTASGEQAVLSIVIHEGRHRQVRKMCDAIGRPVVRLRRVRIGPITDERLRPGEFRELTPREVSALKRAAAGMSHDTAGAGTPAPPPSGARPTRRAGVPRSARAPRSRRRSAGDRPRRG